METLKEKGCRDIQNPQTREDLSGRTVRKDYRESVMSILHSLYSSGSSFGSSAENVTCLMTLQLRQIVISLLRLSLKPLSKSVC